MKHQIGLLMFFICSMAFSQNLEEDIYKAAETFINNKNEASLTLLQKQETLFKNQAVTKDEQLALVFLQCNKGYYLNNSGHLEDAISTYEEASKRFFNHNLSTLSDFDIIESCLKPLGNLYTKTGDYTNAISTINQYIFLAKKNNNKTQQISGAINLAILYQTIGKHEMALKITQSYLDKPNINNSQRQKLKSILLDSQIALDLISNSEDIPKSLDDIAKYKVELDKGHYTTALTYFKKAKALIFKDPKVSARDVAKAYFQEAQLHFLLKNPDDALTNLQKSIKALLPNFNDNGLPNKEDLYAENTFIDIFDLYATLQTDSTMALKSLDLSFYVSGLLQNNWTSQENKLQNQAANRIRSENCINILHREFRLTKDTTYLIKAFQYAENNKASVLKELSQKKTLLQQFPNDSLLIKEFNLLKEQERVTSLLVKEQLGNSQTSKINALSKTLSTISIQLKSLHKAILKRYPTANNNSIFIKKLQEQLKKDHAQLVEYFYGKKTIYQFIISNNNITLNAIPLTIDTKQHIIGFIHLFDDASNINNDINAFTAQAFNLFKLLKFNGVSKSENIIVIPDGLLNFIPFEALLTAKTNTTSFPKMPFVVKIHNIAYNSSTLFYLKNIETTKNNRLLGFFPVFENKNQTLTYSIDEANAIQKEMDATLFMNSKASKSNFIKNARNYSILHLSTHASSGDFVNPATISFYDDTMSLHELYGLNLKFNLVVLSACETGIGKLYKGEGAMSIARGFQYAGVENLLFSLWQINDLSTSQIMQSFYNNYNKHHSAFMANHNSKIEYLEDKSISNVKKSPYYWSAFVYYGSFNRDKSQNYIFYMVIGILITILVLLLILKLKKHATIAF